jgi:hypothetical protein
LTEPFIYNGIEIPGEVIDALDSRTLVLFVGAGLSQDVGYPCFKKLAEAIASRCGWRQPIADPIDSYLQRIENKAGKVHQVAHEILCNWPLANLTCSLPHRVLLELFGEPPGVKIITTNYDLLFEVAACLIGWRLSTRSYGDRLHHRAGFNGIAHLHGCLLDSPSALVLTEGDFSDAYDASKDASRLLDEIFRLTVLFIGYRLADYRLRTLIRSLTKKYSGRKHFYFWHDSAVAHSPRDQESLETVAPTDDTDLDHLGLERIRYRKTNAPDEHSLLFGCLAALTRWRKENDRNGRALSGGES